MIRLISEILKGPILLTLLLITIQQYCIISNHLNACPLAEYYKHHPSYELDLCLGKKWKSSGAGPSNISLKFMQRHDHAI